MSLASRFTNVSRTLSRRTKENLFKRRNTVRNVPRHYVTTWFAANDPEITVHLLQSLVIQGSIHTLYNDQITLPPHTRKLYDRIRTQHNLSSCDKFSAQCGLTVLMTTRLRLLFRRPLTLPLNHSFIHPVTHSVTHSLNHSLTHSPTHRPIHHSLTYSRCQHLHHL